MVFIKKFVSIVLILTMLLTGCGTNDSTDSTEAISNPPVTAKKTYDFIFVCPIVNNIYWEDCINGIKTADEELGTTTRVVGPLDAKNYATEIIGHMEQALADKPDGIMAYAGIEAMFPLINQTVDEGIPFIAIDSDAPDTKRLAYVGINSYNTGYQVGETMIKLTGGKAKVGVMITSQSAKHEMSVLNGFKDCIADYDMEIVVTKETGGSYESSVKLARSMLKKHPDITALFTTGAVTVTGAAKVKKDMKLNNLVLTGMDDTEENLNYVRKGVIDALFAATPYYMGYKGVYLLKEYVDNGSLPEEFYEIGVARVTRDNIDSYKN